MSNSQTPEPGQERVLRSTARNPRRRPRQTENDSLKATAPRRKRSKISEDTFQPLPSTEVGEAHGALMVVPDNGVNGHVPLPKGTGRMTSDTSLEHDMVMRGGKKTTVKRTSRHETGQTLALNACFSVKELPGTPKELKRQGVQYNGSLGAGNHALAVTREKAIVWDYTASVAASNPRVFDVPFSVRADDPLPLGALVPSTTHPSETGLLLISATTGEVVFYESIERAASFTLFQGRNAGVEGSIGKLSFGETVTELVPAEYAGFVVLFSSGRLAQLTLRDSQGKSRISSQFLKIADASTSGLLGSIRGYLGGSHRRDTSSVHVRPLNTRGQMQVVSLTESAVVLIWDIDWSGRTAFRGSIDIRDMLVRELQRLDSLELVGRAESVTALDFAFVDQTAAATGQEVTTVGAKRPLDITVLIGLGSAGPKHYALAEISLEGEKANVLQILAIQSYYAPNALTGRQRPKLALPKLGHSAFVAFEGAVSIMGVQATAEANPEAQLHNSYVNPTSFDETVYLRPGKHLSILATAEEDPKNGHASCVCFVESYGLVRISANDATASSIDVQIPVKSKIEQAVFLGILQPDNIIDFSRKANADYNLDEVVDAALAISDEILRSDTSHTSVISTAPPSMDTHLARKSQALQALIDHLQQNYPALPKSTRWRLLWDAERIAAAQNLWTVFEEHVAASSVRKRTATILDELCAWFVESKETFTRRREISNEDPVRKFFIAGLHRMDKLLADIPLLLEGVENEASKTPEKILSVVTQANEVLSGVMDTALAFRSEHAGRYGILPELLSDGLLVDLAEYTDVPEFWTSTEPLVNTTASVAYFSRELAKKYFEHEGLETVALTELVGKICKKNPGIIKLFCVQSEEAIKWRATRPSEQEHQRADEMRAAYYEQRYEQLRALADVGQADAGMKLAEKYRDMHTLTDMVIAEDEYIHAQLAVAVESEQPLINKSRLELETRIRGYFDRYGEAWSRPFFDKVFSGNMPGVNFVRAQLNWTHALGKYLKADPTRAKLRWINDVTGDANFVDAAGALLQAAKEHETRLWAKKVELSMSKLALLAAREGKGGNDSAQAPNGTAQASSADRELALVSFQDRLYGHIRPELESSLDEQSDTDIIMEKYGSRTVSLSALRSILQTSVERLLAHTVLSVEELIDVLTLMDSVDNEDLDEANIGGDEFFLALEALESAKFDLPSSRFEMLLQLIWRRCYVYDDWQSIQVAGKKSDEERRQALRGTMAWHTLSACTGSGIFDLPSTHIRFLAPSECFSAACAPEDLRYRFPADDLLEPMLRDNQAQNRLLQRYVEHKQLDELVEECKLDAVQFMQQQADEEALLQAQGMDGEALFSDEDTNGYANGHAEVPNGAQAREFEVGNSSSDVEMS